MQHLQVSGAVRPLKWPLGVKWLTLNLYVVHMVTTAIHRAGSAQRHSSSKYRGALAFLVTDGAPPPPPGGTKRPRHSLGNKMGGI